MARLLYGTVPSAIGSDSATINGVTSRLLITPPPDDNAVNGLTIKRPNATWGTDGAGGLAAYGKGQAVELLKHASNASDIGYTGTSPNDLVLARMDSWGAVGLTANLHVATGLRQDSTYAPGYAVQINPYVDTTVLNLKPNGTLTSSYILGEASSGADKFKVTSAGNGVFGMTGASGSETGAYIGDYTSGYVIVAHSSRASATNYALSQGPSGDTYLNSSSGQTLALQINGASKASLTATTFGLTGGVQLLTNDFIQAVEMTAPSAPAANGVRLFARDNGSGKTQWCALFATGAVQVIATEP